LTSKKDYYSVSDS